MKKYKITHKITADFIAEIIVNEDEIIPCGVNAKMSEIHAALGLCNLDNIETTLLMRRAVAKYYLAHLGFEHYRLIAIDNEQHFNNFGYFPIEFKDARRCKYVYEALRSNGFHARRYFSVSLNNVGYNAPQRLLKSESMCRKVLCLPIFPELALNDIVQISRIVDS